MHQQMRLTHIRVATRFIERIAAAESCVGAGGNGRQHQTRLDSTAHATKCPLSSSSPSTSSHLTALPQAQIPFLFPQAQPCQPNLALKSEAETRVTGTAKHSLQLLLRRKLGFKKQLRSKCVPTIEPVQRGSSSPSRNPVVALLA